RYLLDTGIAACYVDRRLGVFDRAQTESNRGNRIGIAHPVLAELVYRVEGGPNRDRNMQRLQLALCGMDVCPGLGRSQRKVNDAVLAFLGRQAMNGEEDLV